MDKFIKYCILFLLVYAVVCFCAGCGSFVDTLADVSSDVPGYIQESSGLNIAVGDIFPDGSDRLSMFGLGYLVCFLRKWYVNAMRKKNGGK